MKTSIKIALALFIAIAAGFSVFYFTNHDASAYIARQGVTKCFVVLDGGGAPIAGASVTIKERPGTGILTDLDGRACISAGDSETIVISYIGYKTKEIKFAMLRDNGEYWLEEDTEQLE